MSTLVWRRLLLALCAAGLVLTGVSLCMLYTGVGMAGISAQNAALYNVPGKTTKTPFVFAIIAVSPGGAAQRAGLKAGDLVDTRQLSAGDRFRWYTLSWRAGTHVRVPLVDGKRTHWRTMVVDPMPVSWDILLGFIAGFWLLLFAALIAWRRPENVEAHTLALLLILYTAGSDLTPGLWFSAWPALDAALGAFAWVLQFAGFALLATYAMLVVRRRTLLRSTLAWLSYGSSCAGALIGIAYVAG